jgi:hypothetical protein
MSDIGVGKEVLSHCGKCKLALAHMIVVMKDESTIGKVQCNTCKATHAYKDPSKTKAKKRATTTKKKSTRTPKASVADMWLEAVNNSKSKSQDYSIRTTFTVGDIIDHVKFGPGVVERVFDGDKMEVIFRHDIKTLIHGK